MKRFISDCYHLFIAIVMSIPFHRLRIFVLRCFKMKIGKHTAICRNVDIRSPYRIVIGSHSTINKNVVLDGRVGVTIGDNVDIAQDVHVWSLQHDYNSPSYASIGNSVVIEDYVWIASRVTILPVSNNW